VNPVRGALHVLLQFLRAKESGDPYAFQFEPQDYILPTAGGELLIGRFDWTPVLRADLRWARMGGDGSQILICHQVIDRVRHGTVSPLTPSAVPQA
jgi:hypothetical protein